MEHVVAQNFCRDARSFRRHEHRPDVAEEAGSKAEASERQWFLMQTPLGAVRASIGARTGVAARVQRAVTAPKRRGKARCERRAR